MSEGGAGRLKTCFAGSASPFLQNFVEKYTFYKFQPFNFLLRFSFSSKTILGQLNFSLKYFNKQKSFNF